MSCILLNAFVGGYIDYWHIHDVNNIKSCYRVQLILEPFFRELM